jgi:hypothetical protein
MARFFDLDDGESINLDLVTTVIPLEDGNWAYIDAAGKTIAEGLTQDLEGLTEPVVSAAAGTVAVVIRSRLCGRPVAESLKVVRIPVVAWRITRFGASPILPDIDNDREDVVLLEVGDKLIWLGEARPLNSIDEALSVCLDHLQSIWDIRHKDK